MIIYTGTQNSAIPSLNSSMQEGEVQFSSLDNKALEAKIGAAKTGAAKLEAKRGMILPFQPLSISFDDIKYYVDMPAVRLSFIFIYKL